MTTSVRTIVKHGGKVHDEYHIDKHWDYWFNTYTPEGLQHVYRDKVGTKRSQGWPWLPIRCNVPNCPFRGLVSRKWLEEMAQLAFIAEDK